MFKNIQEANVSYPIVNIFLKASLYIHFVLDLYVLYGVE